jgi:hypothetical protein
MRWRKHISYALSVRNKFRAAIMHLVVGQGAGQIEAHDAEVPQLLTVIRRPREGISQGTGIASRDEFLIRHVRKTLPQTGGVAGDDGKGLGETIVDNAGLLV